jgi:hypothetical protein
LDYDSIPKPPDLPEGWIARFIEPGDEEGILRVMTEAFQPWPKLPCSVTPLEHLRWKLASHPVAAKIHVVVDSPDGIVGARLDWGLRCLVGEHERDVRLSIDRAVRPKYRRNYAMSAMRNYRQQIHDERFEMYAGYSSDAPYLDRLRKYRVRGVTRYQRLIDVLSCDDVFERDSEATHNWKIRRIDVFDERVDVLWAAARKQFLFGVVRSSSHLNWRYADRRAGDYVVLAAEEDDRWLGYVVMRASSKTGHIADLIALPERLDVVDSLLGAALDHVRAGGQRRVECWSEPHGVYRWSLDKAGFRQARRSIGLTFRPLKFPAEEAAFLGDPAAPLHITAGDTDLV